MESNKFRRSVAGVLCILAFAAIIFGCGYVISAFLRPYEAPTEPAVEATTEGTTEATTEATTETTEPDVTVVPTEPVVQLPQLSLKAKQAFLFIPGTGQMIMLKGRADQRIYPASLTKLFTALVALQIMKIDDTVEVGNEISLVPDGSSIAGLSRGDRVTVQMLIEGMLLPSGNDAAMVLATAVGRVLAKDESLGYKAAIARFVEEMNQEAVRQGLTGTHFANPDGYHQSNHYTTSADMQKIAQLAMSNGVILRTVGIWEKPVDIKSPYVDVWQNTNLLLQPDGPYYNPCAIGLKTGFTRSAGYCLISSFEVDGEVFTVGVFGCEEATDRFSDAQTIFKAYINR